MKNSNKLICFMKSKWKYVHVYRVCEVENTKS